MAKEERFGRAPGASGLPTAAFAPQQVEEAESISQVNVGFEGPREHGDARWWRRQRAPRVEPHTRLAHDDYIPFDKSRSMSSRAEKLPLLDLSGFKAELVRKYARLGPESPSDWGVTGRDVRARPQFVCMWEKAGGRYQFEGDESLVTSAIDYLHRSRGLRRSIADWKERHGEWDGRTAHTSSYPKTLVVPESAWSQAPLSDWIEGLLHILTWYQQHVRFGEHVSHNKYRNEVRLGDGFYWRETPGAFPWLAKHQALVTTLRRTRTRVQGE